MVSKHIVRIFDSSANTDIRYDFPTVETTIIRMNVPTHLPTKLTQMNFLVWRTQIQSTLIGLGILDYLDGTIISPTFLIWNHRDKIIKLDLFSKLN